VIVIDASAVLDILLMKFSSALASALRIDAAHRADPPEGASQRSNWARSRPRKMRRVQSPAGSD